MSYLILLCTFMLDPAIHFSYSYPAMCIHFCYSSSKLLSADRLHFSQSQFASCFTVLTIARFNTAKLASTKFVFSVALHDAFYLPSRSHHSFRLFFRIPARRKSKSHLFPRKPPDSQCANCASTGEAPEPRNITTDGE